MMNIALGIDTGGTYTDAVLAEHDNGKIYAGTKSLTTRHDLSIGIKKAIEGVFTDQSHNVLPKDINLVALSTTLATNSIVEGHGNPICLLLIGYDESLIKNNGFEDDLVTNKVEYIEGGHDTMGNELGPLDEEAVKRAILKHKDYVEAFAISGFFGVLNPNHELRVKEIVRELTKNDKGISLPVTCGHELSSNLNSVKRATTVALNATLIPLLQELMLDVDSTLKQQGIDAPLMVVKGDGSLMKADWAMQRPVETILSGPAASVVGAYHLAKKGDVWVVDMGGTTTDIASLSDGRPKINPNGAMVGRFRTMVEAIDVQTAGLGGDSHVKVNYKQSDLIDCMSVGPNRVIPLCILADQYPEVITDLKSQIADEYNDVYAEQFVILNRKAEHQLPEEDLLLISKLAAGPKSIATLKGLLDSNNFFIAKQLEKLRTQRLILQAGFTPTDALHVLGRMSSSNSDASRLGAEILAKKAGLAVEDFCQRIVSGVSDLISIELVNKVLCDETTEPNWKEEPAAVNMLQMALGNKKLASLNIKFTFNQPIVAVGAPVEAYFPKSADQLNTDLIIPNHAEIANAIGALSGGVLQQKRIKISPLDGVEVGYRVHLPDGIHDFGNLEEGVSFAHDNMVDYVKEQAKLVGADHVEVKMTRDDQIALIGVGGGAELFLGSDLVFTATGRPKIAGH
jgi:N-methylhydantoinase A/oxoprolinase/acetone carboxylase beta subunit